MLKTAISETLIQIFQHDSLARPCLLSTWPDPICCQDSHPYVCVRLIQSLFIAVPCHVQAYQRGECLEKVFLKAEKGPAVITRIFPWGSKPQGEVFSPLHLFGDPSLVVVKSE